MTGNSYVNIKSESARLYIPYLNDICSMLRKVIMWTELGKYGSMYNFTILWIMNVST